MDVFAQTIGHQTARQVILRMIENNMLPHALLIVGQEHIGKTHLATTLIQHLFKTQKSLSAIADVSVLERETDVKTEKTKTAISVKQIRALVERLSMTPIDGEWKAAFIESADCLSIGAANALLKTLEEPKGRAIIILRAPSVESVLPTIASRCQIMRLSPVTNKEIVRALEKRGLSKQQAGEISELSLGRPGIAIGYIKDSALRARKETAINQVQTLFSEPLSVQLKAVLTLIPKTETDKTIALSTLLDDWTEALRNNLLKQVKENKQLDSEKTAGILKRICEVHEAMKHNINPHLALEHIFLSTHI